MARNLSFFTCKLQKEGQTPSRDVPLSPSVLALPQVPMVSYEGQLQLLATVRAPASKLRKLVFAFWQLSLNLAPEEVARSLKHSFSLVSAPG